jgi:acyl-CoA-binding protein
VARKPGGGRLLGKRHLPAVARLAGRDAAPPGNWRGRPLSPIVAVGPGRDRASAILRMQPGQGRCSARRGWPCGIRRGPGIATRGGQAAGLVLWHQDRAGDRHQGRPGGAAGPLASGSGRRSPPGAARRRGWSSDIRSGPGIATRGGQAAGLALWHQARAGDRHQGRPGGGAGPLTSGAGRGSPPGAARRRGWRSGIRRGPGIATRGGQAGRLVLWHRERAGDRHQGRPGGAAGPVASSAGRGSPPGAARRRGWSSGIRIGPEIATRGGQAARLALWHQARAGDRHQGRPGGGAGPLASGAGRGSPPGGKQSCHPTVFWALASGAGRRSPPGGGETVLSPDRFLGSGIRSGPRTARAVVRPVLMRAPAVV